MQQSEEGIGILRISSKLGSIHKILLKRKKGKGVFVSADIWMFGNVLNVYVKKLFLVSKLGKVMYS